MNDFIQKNGKWLLIGLGIACIALVVILILKPSPHKELRDQFDKERKDLSNQYNTAEKRIESLRKDSIEIRLRMKKDIEFFQKEIAVQNLEYKNLKKQYDKVDYSNYTSTQLDSLRAWILSRQ